MTDCSSELWLKKNSLVAHILLLLSLLCLSSLTIYFWLYTYIIIMISCPTKKTLITSFYGRPSKNWLCEQKILYKKKLKVKLKIKICLALEKLFEADVTFKKTMVVFLVSPHRADYTLYIWTSIAFWILLEIRTIKNKKNKK